NKYTNPITTNAIPNTTNKSSLLTADTEPNKYPIKSAVNPFDKEIKIALKPIPADNITGMANSSKCLYTPRSLSIKREPPIAAPIPKYTGFNALNNKNCWLIYKLPAIPANAT